MSLAKVTRNFQVTIPANIREMLHIVIGTLLDFTVEKGSITIKPKTLIDEDQAWFWTKEWQKGEKEVDKAIRKGQTRTFKSVAAMRKHFEKD